VALFNFFGVPGLIFQQSFSGSNELAIHIDPRLIKSQIH
jgi:hypothetical protein